MSEEQTTQEPIKVKKTFLDFLGEKGKIATIIGLLFALPVNIKFIVDFYRGVAYSADMLEGIIFINIISMIWFILPSKITLKGKNIELEVTD